MTKRCDCLGLGIAPADIIMQINAFPKPGAKIDCTGMVIQGGGPIPTAMVALARLGFRPALISAVGDDIFGRFVLDELIREKVDVSLIKIKKDRTAIAVGWAEEKTGRRTIALDLGIRVTPGDIKTRELPLPRLVHLDGRYMPTCLKLARWAKKRGVPVVFDIGSMRNDVSALMPLADHLVCAEDFALPFTKSRTVTGALKKLFKLGPTTVVITSGIKGAIGYCAKDGLVHQKAFRVKVIDTTGAGDAYHGAYLAGLLKGWDLSRRMEFASAVAAINCMRLGGRAGLPTYNQVCGFLSKRGTKDA